MSISMERDVASDAACFIDDEEELFKQALVDGATRGFEVSYDDNGQFHEAVVDRSYTLEDAAYVVSRCEHEETDWGLWDGIKQPEDALCIKAAYCYANDVRAEIDRIFEELADWYDQELAVLQERRDHLEEMKEESDDGALPVTEQKELEALEDCEPLAAEVAFKKFQKTYRNVPAPIEPGSEREAVALRKWLKLQSGAGMWGGYPFGSSYIDARCGTGYGMPEVKEYVDYDQELADLCPQHRGKSRDQIAHYAKEAKFIE